MPKRDRNGALTIPAAGGRADQGELRQLQAQTARLRSLVDDDVEPVILHRGIEIFLDRRLEPMDFVDEKDIAFFQTGEQAPASSPAFSITGPLVFLMFTLHRVRDDVGQRGLAESGRATQQECARARHRASSPLRPALQSRSHTFTWPVNSLNIGGRNEI